MLNKKLITMKTNSIKSTIVLLFSIISALFICGCNEKVQNAPDRYNFQRALDVFENNNTEEVIQFCEKDLEENPKDARTLAMLAAAYHVQNHNGEALEIIDRAVNLWSGIAGYKVVNPYYLRGNILLELEDTIMALKDFEQALRISDENNKWKIIEDQMEIYYAQQDYEKLSEIAQKSIKKNRSHVMSYFYLAMIAIEEKRYNDAFDYADKIEKLDKEKLSHAQYIRALASRRKGDYEVAANNIVELLQSEGGNNTGFSMMIEMTDSMKQFDAMKNRLEIQVENDPNEDYWYYCLGTLYDKKNAFVSAIENFKKSAELDADAITYERIMFCYSSLGDFKNALRYADKALLIDSAALNVIRVKSELLMLEGRQNESLKCANELVSLDPLSYVVYENRADLYQFAGKIDEAIKDYGKAISLFPEDSYNLIQRGKLLLKQGLVNKANADFKKVLVTDSVPDEFSSAQYAYYYLKEIKKAQKHMNKILAKDSSAGTYYDAACLYSLLNDTIISIKYLRQAFEKGYRQFRHIEMDADLDNVRNSNSFKSLLREYIQKGIAEETTLDSVVRWEAKQVTSEVPFLREGGVCKVKCKINGLPLHFIFDTGATDVTLSMVEATFMMKNGYLSKQDVTGTGHYMDANGNVSIGTVINLKNVNFGDFTLNNIRASVVQNQKAPLLLGQSVLVRLGKIEIDNSKCVLKITKND